MTIPQTVIRAQRVLDGTGAAAQPLDLGLADDRIVAMEPFGSLRDGRLIDAGDRLVCPGFIDTHSHSDTYLLLEPDAPSKITQGITTEVIGQCGSSAAPLYGVCRLPADWKEKHYCAHWASLADFRQLLAAAPAAVNIVALIGHNTLRASVMGNAARPATPGERTEMIRMLERCLDEGAWGWSTGLLYTPGKWADNAELLELAACVAKSDGIYATHLRNESTRLPEAIDEALTLARDSGVRLQISHLKVTGDADLTLSETVLDTLESARDRGIDVAADKYPYEASCTDLDILLPDDIIRDGHAQILKHLRDPSLRLRLAQRLNGERDSAAWQRIVIGSTFHPQTHPFQGLPLLDAATRLQLSPAETVLFLIDNDELKTSAFFFNMPDEPNRRLYSGENVMIGSDASLRAPWGVLGREFPHPRAYGTFPRFFRRAVDELGWSTEKTIHRMTGLPARHFRIPDRGVLRTGAYADIVILDPDNFRDRATYADPRRFSTGIEHLLVNGIPIITDGRRTGRRPGRWLERRSR